MISLADLILVNKVAVAAVVSLNLFVCTQVLEDNLLQRMQQLVFFGSNFAFLSTKQMLVVVAANYLINKKHLLSLSASIWLIALFDRVFSAPLEHVIFRKQGLWTEDLFGYLPLELFQISIGIITYDHFNTKLITERSS